jgi:hypothetical protein
LCVVLAAFVSGGCALSYEEDGERHVVGLFALETEASDGAVVEARHFTFYGVWFDDAFRGTGVAVGQVDLSVGDLRNQWQHAAATGGDPEIDGECSDGFGFQWCSLGPRRSGRAGEVFDIAVAGVTIGAGDQQSHFGVGYHRQTLLEVTNENALVAWPLNVEVESLLRGSFTI